MARISEFEDIEAWRHARELLCELRQDVFSDPLKRDFRLAAQIRDSADSTMANIAEGFERGRLTEFRQFLSIAKGSCGELRSHLYVAHDFGYITPDRFGYLLEKAKRVARIIGGLRRAVDQKCRTQLTRS
jgi:four helix bundle protein